MKAARLITGSTDPESGGSLSFHETPAELTTMLLDHQPLPATIWEPACGRGAISRVLEGAGHAVISTDLARRGYGQGGINFLRCEKAFAPAIVTNPPFDNQGGERFAAHALRLLAEWRGRAWPRVVALLHRFRWIETEARDPLFLHPAFRRVIVKARKRAPMMHREGYEGAKLKSSPEIYAWFVWELDAPRDGNFDRFEMVRA